MAAAYALGRPRPWASGLLAGLIIGGAHLVSPFAVVALFELVSCDPLENQLPRVSGAILIALGMAYAAGWL